MSPKRYGRLFLGFFMFVVFAAITAIFLDRKPIRVVLFVLHGCIVAPFARSASQGDNDSIVLFSQFPLLLSSTSCKASQAVLGFYFSPGSR